MLSKPILAQIDCLIQLLLAILIAKDYLKMIAESKPDPPF